MNLNDYQFEAAKTAIHPTDGYIGILYASIALCGEVGEVANKVKKIVRDFNGTVTPEMKSALKLELGDTLWYIADMATLLGTSLEEIALLNLQKLKTRKQTNKLKGEGDAR